MEVPMNGRKLASALAAALLGLTAVVPTAVSAGSLGTVDGLPFFGQPYPYGYVYHRPPADCYHTEMVETPVGPRIAVTWVCEGAAPVSARF
jgi:hypothetical protein